MKAFARALGAAGLALGAAGCDDHAVTVEAGAPASSASAVVAGLPPARRPTRRYYLGMTAGRCEIYTVDGEVVSTPVAARCPQEIKDGERIRIAGKTCTRESPVADRQEPVVCPDPLTNKEKDDRARERADGG